MKKTHIIIILILSCFFVSCSESTTITDTENEQNTVTDTDTDTSSETDSETEKETIAKVPITAFWWNGSWDHYDGAALQYIDEFIIFAIPPNPDTGALLEYSHDEATGVTTYIKGKTQPGLTTTMVDQIVEDANKYGTKLTLGINGMGRKDKYFNGLVDNGLSATFAANVRDFCTKYGITAVDVDYEHPDDAYDIGNLATLFTSLRDTLHPADIHVSGAFGASRTGTKQFLVAHHELLDQINIMGYTNDLITYKSLIQYLVDNGVPKNKIFGGHGFYYKDKKENVSINHRNLVDLVENLNDLDVVNITNPNEPYQEVSLVNNNSDATFSQKVDFIRDNGYGGIMIYQIGQDLPVSDPRSKLVHMHAITNPDNL
ncbi:MAG: glycoside hydrolase family 18 protein [Flavicella sp.]